LAHLALLPHQRAQLPLLPSLLLLDLCQAIGKRARIIRLGWNGGDEQQQRRQGADCWTDYSGGAPAEPGIPGSRRGVKLGGVMPAPPNGAGAPFGCFSFFFFFGSRFPLSRDFAMVPASLT
jgi:hypothetical protein